MIEGRQTLSEQIYTAVRERILGGQLAPSTVLKPRDVEQTMRVSRTPVREALQRLVSEGFLEAAPRQGFRVPDLSIDDLVDLYPAVQLLEMLAFDLAIPRIRPTDLVALETLNEAFAEAIGSGDVAAAVDANTRFHECLAEMCGNRPLCRLLEDLRLRVRRLEMLDFGEVVLTKAKPNGRTPKRDLWVKQHADIIAAMRKGAFDTARELLQRNRSLLLNNRKRQVRAPSETAANAASSASASRSRAGRRG